MTEEFDMWGEGLMFEEDDRDTSPETSVMHDGEIYENVKEVNSSRSPSSSQGQVEKMGQWCLMLLGRRGAGKSSTGNTILGRYAFNTDMQLSRVTQQCERAEVRVQGRHVAVIDTPGLHKTKHMEKEVMRDILKSASLWKPGLHAFLLVLPVGNLTNEDKDMQKLIERMFGKSVWKYTIVVFTQGDRLEGKTPDDIIGGSDRALREFIRSCSGGFIFFDNKNMENRKQVAQLMEKVQTLVAINGRSCYTTALYPLRERKIRQRQERILEERQERILRKEQELAENYEDVEELERQMRELWREEEEDARKLAESSNKRKVSINLVKVHSFSTNKLSTTDK